MRAIRPQELAAKIAQAERGLLDDEDEFDEDDEEEEYEDETARIAHAVRLLGRTAHCSGLSMHFDESSHARTFLHITSAAHAISAF